ncbi:MAG: hypothetical protein ACXVLQ_12960 [Bacteriovorax sp.]
MKSDKYYSLEDLKKMKYISEDFANFLLKREKANPELIENPMFIAGMRHGVASALQLLNEYLIQSDGKFNRERAELMFEKITSTHKSPAHDK